MTIRTYTQTDFIEDFRSEIGAITGTGLNLEASATLAFGGVANGDDSYLDPIQGHLNFDLFPAIPDNATITKIRCYLDGNVNADLAGVSAGPICSASANVVIWSDYWGTGVLFDAITANFTTSLGGSGSDSDSRRLEFIKDYVPGISKDQLKLEFGGAGAGATFHFQLTASVTQDGASTGGGNADAEMANWTFEVTYTSGPFSWYLQTHTETIGGKPSIVVDDIVPVDEGTTPPAGSTFYGTGENFPTEADIPLYYWYDPVTFTILFQAISPFSGLPPYDFNSSSNSGPASILDFGFSFRPSSSFSPSLIWNWEFDWILLLIDFVGDSSVDDPVSNLHFDMALESVVVLMTDPSGIYTLVEGQRHDTLYERFVGVPSINVKIPNPFAKTGYIP